VRTGAAYVVFGRCDDATMPTVMDTTFLDDTRGVQIYSRVPGELGGYAVGSVGDIDGDGSDEVLMGAPYNNDAGSYAGAAYVVTGC